jgi:transcriptional regulator of NAD metabolism
MKYGKVANIAIFITITFIFAYFIWEANLFLPEQKISNIKLKGCEYLTEEEYAQYAYLNDPVSFKYLNQKIVIDRLLKHPYIKEVRAIIDNKGEIQAEIVEKNFIGEINLGRISILIDDEKRLSRKIKNLKNLKVPIISGVGLYNKNLSELEQSEDVIIIYKILMASKFLSENFFKNISKIAIDKGKAVLYLENGNLPCLINTENYDENLFCIYMFLKKTIELRTKVSNELAYIDGRFKNKIFLGFK